MESFIGSWQSFTLNPANFFYQKDRTNWSVLESYQGKNKSHPFEVRHVTGIAQQASNSLDRGLFVAAYAEFLSDGHKYHLMELVLKPFA
ncbi:hypothetical protein H5410_041457 [Solanum commersonii]|uniref:Uncharacterized protein n=1 Tax=Solanum commersonii TaxID=4109 RepID=A0A9J5XTN9_SOLCO|nr:hypothetical protein H5410_041457 [Solanum commersonii]